MRRRLLLAGLVALALVLALLGLVLDLVGRAGAPPDAATVA
jgi:hypothetical protein